MKRAPLAGRRAELLRIGMIAPLLLVWFAVSTLVLIGRGDVERLLHSTFGHQARPDAFEGLNQVASLFWAVIGGHLGLALVAAWRRRIDVLLVLLIGPGIALGLCVLLENWSDPNWHNVIGVCTIGWLVGTLVAGGYGLATLRSRPRNRP